MPNRKPQSVVTESASEQFESLPAEVLPHTVIDDALENVQATSKRALDEVVAYTQSHPDKALLFAVTTGYALRVLPVARLLGGVIRLAVPLVKPAVLFYGISKLVSSRRS